MDPLKQINKALSTVTESIDDNIYSAEEQDKEITERLRIDNTSKFAAAHLVRPFTFGWSILMLSITDFLIVKLAFANMQGVELAAVLIGVATTWSGLVGMMSKFYFQSRGNEKIEFKKAQVEEKKIVAAIKIERIRAGTESSQAKFDMSEERKDSKAERKQDKKDNRRGLFRRKDKE